MPRQDRHTVRLSKGQRKREARQRRLDAEREARAEMARGTRHDGTRAVTMEGT